MRALVLAAALFLTGCQSRDARDAQEYWSRLEVRSIEVTRELLDAAAAGDSAALAATAADSVVAELLDMHGRAETRAIASAARQFDPRAAQVQVFGHGAFVGVPYTLEGTSTRAGFWTGYQGNRLVVTDFAEHVKVD